MADEIVRQLHEEFKKINISCAKAADVLVAKVDAHEKDKHSKLQKYLDGKSELANVDIARMGLVKEQKYFEDAEQDMIAAKEATLKAEKREEDRVDELLNNTSMLRRSELDQDKDQSMREMYQDMLDKLAEMHTVSRQSQNMSLTNDRLKLDEQVTSMRLKTAELRREVDRLSAALDATGYEGLLHDTRRALMVSMKNEYTGMKNELLRLRLGTHSLRIRARTAQANLALEK